MLRNIFSHFTLSLNNVILFTTLNINYILHSNKIPEKARAALIDVVFPVSDGPNATTMGHPENNSTSLA